MTRVFINSIATIAIALVVCSAEGAPPAVIAELVTAGFAIDDSVAVPITPPLLSGDMSGDEQRRALAKLVGDGRVERFLENRVVAPHKVIVGAETIGAERITVRRLDQYFVVYGDLTAIRDEKLLSGFVASSQGANGAGLEQYVEAREQGDSQVSRYRIVLLNKVVVSGLVQTRAHEAAGLLIQSAVSDRLLLDDADNPTVWQAIPRRAESDADLGPPTAYRGLAGYLQVCELKFQPGALLVECHAVLVEPRGWFGGKNLLASKLPIAAQENVRSFRRKLKSRQ